MLSNQTLMKMTDNTPLPLHSTRDSSPGSSALVSSAAQQPSSCRHCKIKQRIRNMFISAQKFRILLKRLILLCIMLSGLPLNHAIAGNNDFGANIQLHNASSTKEQQQRLNRLFGWLNAVSTKQLRLSSEQVHHYFTDSIEYSINGKVLAKNNTELKQRLENFLSVKTAEIIFPIKYTAFGGQQAAVVYQLRINPKRQAGYTDTIFALIDFNKQLKITRWQAVIERTTKA